MSKIKTALSGTGIVIALVIALAVMIGGGWAWTYYTASIKGKVQAEQIINKGTNRIQEYEKFFDMCANVQSMKTALVSQKSLLDSAESSKERSRVRANIAGMEAQLARYVNQYNAQTNKEYTAARFKSSDLPYQLSVNDTTICQ